MLKHVLDYTWARNQLVNAVALFVYDADSLFSEDAALVRAAALSERIVQCVSQDTFDEYRANLMLAREVAYWREWLAVQSDRNERGNSISPEVVRAIEQALGVFSRFSF